MTALRFELTSQGQKVSRLPTESPGRPTIPSTIRSCQSGTWSTGQEISEEHRKKSPTRGNESIKTKQRIETEEKKETNTAKKSVVLLVWDLISRTQRRPGNQAINTTDSCVSTTPLL